MKKIQFGCQLTLLFVILISSWACSETKSENLMNNDGYITVVVSEFDLKESANHPDKGTTLVSSLILYNGYTVCRELLDKEYSGKIASDTLLFYTNSYSNSVYLAITNHQDVYSYLAHPGDTLFVDFRENKPVVISTWKNQKKCDFTWQNEIESRINNLYPNKIINGQKKFHLKAEKNYKMIENYIDSLFQESLLSGSVYESAKLDIKYFIENLKISANIKKDYFPLDLFFQNDSALNSDIYRSMLHKYAYRNVDFVNYNPVNLFNEILSDPILTHKSKSYLLFHVLSHISEANNMDVFKPNAEVFLTFVNEDSIWKYHIETITPMPTITSKEMLLYDINMKQLDFVNLMDSYKGKVVYIDVWASWCSPCRAVMPAAKELREKYQDKPVVFLYLAYNDQQNPWKKYMTEYNLNEGNANSFLIASLEAEWVKEMGIKTIPRYMIYDKDGKLISKNAPDPKGSQIIELINSLL